MKHIVIDNNNFTILEGTKGVYPISDIVKMSIVCEDARYKGKTDPFKHLVLDGKVQMGWLDLPKFYIGIQFEMKDGSHLALYISDHPVQFERGSYFEEQQEAQQIIDTIKRSM